MGFSEIKDYYDTIRGSYILLCKEEKNADLKSKLGDRFNSLLTVLFVLTFSQIIPLSLLRLLPEAFKMIPIWKFGIPIIIPINIVILIILKLLHSLNKDKLVYAKYSSKYSYKRQRTHISPLQKAFSAIFTSLIELKSYSETNDEFHIRKASKNFDIFKDTLPFELCYLAEYPFPVDSFFFKSYRENNLPWFILSVDQIDDFETIRYFVSQTCLRIWDKEKLNDIIPSLEALAKVYFDAIKDKHAMSEDFLAFKEKAKQIPSFKRTPRSQTARIEEKIEAFSQKVTENFLVYFLLSFLVWLIVTFILVYWPCRGLFDASPKMLAPVVFATAITLALMDTNKNVKTDLSRKEQRKKIELHDDEQNKGKA